MNRKGFTLIELMVVLAILAIVAAVVIPNIRSAHGMELLTPMPASDAMIDDVAAAMEYDPGTNVIVLIYMVEWTNDNISPAIKEAKRVRDRLLSRGVSSSRIVTEFANKGGLVDDKVPTPAADGVYLYLD